MLQALAMCARVCSLAYAYRRGCRLAWRPIGVSVGMGVGASVGVCVGVGVGVGVGAGVGAGVGVGIGVAMGVAMGWMRWWSITAQAPSAGFCFLSSLQHRSMLSEFSICKQHEI